MGGLLLKNATWIDWRTCAVRRCHIEVTRGSLRTPGARGDAGDHPTSVRLHDTLPETTPAATEVFDCNGRIVTRSFVVGHHHIYSALARGMPPPARAPRTFNEILDRIWWNLDKQLDGDMIRASALATAVEAAWCGCTFLIDHHASPHAAPDSLHIIGEALDEVGLGHLLCYELSDRDGPQCLQQGFDESRAWLREHPGLVGLHASFTVSDETLAAALQLAETTSSGIHIHVAEAASDQQATLEKHGKRVVERLHAAGGLSSPKSLLVHCLHLDDDERALLADSPVWVVQNPESNQNNGVGTFDPTGLGDRIFLGTDGMHSDMLASTRAAYLDSRRHVALSPLEAYTRLRRVHDYLRQNGFPGDGEDNLVVLDYPTPTPVTADNWPAHVVYALHSRHVTDVVSQGRWVVRDRQLVGVDGERILSQAREQAERLWKRL